MVVVPKMVISIEELSYKMLHRPELVSRFIIFNLTRYVTFLDAFVINLATLGDLESYAGENYIHSKSIAGCSSSDYIIFHA